MSIHYLYFCQTCGKRAKLHVDDNAICDCGSWVRTSAEIAEAIERENELYWDEFIPSEVWEPLFDAPIAVIEWTDNIGTSLATLLSAAHVH